LGLLSFAPLEVALMGDPVFFQLTFRRIYSILVVMIWQTVDGKQARPPVWAGPFPWLPGCRLLGNAHIHPPGGHSIEDFTSQQSWFRIILFPGLHFQINPMGARISTLLNLQLGKK